MEPDLCHVKQEPDEDAGSDVSEAATCSGLYAGYLVKDELVLEPCTMEQIPPNNTHNATHQVTAVKQEPSCEVTSHEPVPGNTQGTEDGDSCTAPVDVADVKHEHEDTTQENVVEDDRASPLALGSAAAADEQSGSSRHTQTHSGQVPAGDTRGKQVATNSDLTTHKPNHTGDKPYSCDICNKSYMQLNSLVTHTRIHTGEKPFSCDICNKKFYESGILANHKRMHTGEKPYSCDICNKKFSLSGNLKVHKLVHTDERPFSCKICNKKFKQQYYLTQHIRIHTGEKPYSCDMCTKKFTGSTGLLAHKRIHTGNKPYSCEICNERFTKYGDLTTHKLKCIVASEGNTSDNTFSCDICDKQFNQLSDLTDHKRIHSVSSCKTCNKPTSSCSCLWWRR